MLHYRRPWYLLFLIAFGAAIATLFVHIEATSHIRQNQRQFDSSQLLRLTRIELHIDDYFGDAVQLADSGAKILAYKNVNPKLAEAVILGLFRSHENPNVYGVGSFYAPFALDPQIHDYFIYAHADKRKPSGVGMVIFQHAAYDPASDYTTAEFYRIALQSPGNAAFYGPHKQEGHNFITTEKAIVSGHRVIGVIIVDTLTSAFTSIMSSSLIRGDVAYIQNRTTKEILVTTSRLPKNISQRIERTLPLRYTHASIHLISDASGVYAEKQTILVRSLAIIGAIWVLAVLLAWGLIGHWFSREATMRLEQRRLQLENDIAVANKVEIELRKEAHTDTLTRLPNRAAFWEFASAILARSSSTIDHAVYFIDLDRFNLVNDTRGHLIGDELLKEIAMRLRADLSPGISVSRLGGDEFVLIAQIGNDGPHDIAKNILRIISEPFLLAENALYITASIGVVLVDPSYEQPEELLRDADIAMYRAKHDGRARYAIFDSEMRRKVESDSLLERDLRNAITHREFIPYYQPIIEIQTGKIVSFEALARWKRPNNEITGAAEFISYAEAHGLIAQIDSAIFESVCADAGAIFAKFPQATIAVNISATDLERIDLAADITQALRTHHIPPSSIKLEITETAAMSNTERSFRTLEELSSNGIEIILDDFGSGRSSLAYLHKLPITGVKIDQSFNKALASDPQAVAIVRTIVSLAQTLGFSTVAEGIESEEQLEILRSLGVSCAQGFHFSAAIELAALLEFGTSL